MSQFPEAIAVAANAVTAVVLITYGAQMRALAIAVVKRVAELNDGMELFCQNCNKTTSHTFLPVITNPPQETLACKICISRRIY